MRILIACESSNVLARSFRIHHPDSVYSVDLKPNEQPSEFHIQDDILSFLTRHPDWDLLVAHPPCTYLSNVASQHLLNDPLRVHKQLQALDFAERLWNQPQIPRIAIENPRSALAHRLGPAHYTYQPWYFGEPYSKFTCLWLKNLPPPRQTHFRKPSVFLNRNRAGNDITPIRDRATTRSRTLPKVAEALALAWSPSL